MLHKYYNYKPHRIVVESDFSYGSEYKLFIFTIGNTYRLCISSVIFEDKRYSEHITDFIKNISFEEKRIYILYKPNEYYCHVSESGIIIKHTDDITFRNVLNILSLITEYRKYTPIGKFFNTFLWKLFRSIDYPSLRTGRNVYKDVEFLEIFNNKVNELIHKEIEKLTEGG